MHKYFLQPQFRSRLLPTAVSFSLNNSPHTHITFQYPSPRFLCSLLLLFTTRYSLGLVSSLTLHSSHFHSITRSFLPFPFHSHRSSPFHHITSPFPFSHHIYVAHNLSYFSLISSLLLPFPRVISSSPLLISSSYPSPLSHFHSSLVIAPPLRED